ncbi:MAG: hypothetical protein HY306_01030, partial [Nitrosomonadales bacterium]|nr:hypothetical protein [Nitrosomonadales bacterium]
MTGGGGNDTYYVDNVSDTIIENANIGLGGTDTVIASISYTLGAGLENLTLVTQAGTGVAGAGTGLTAVGNAGNNIITDSTTGTNTLVGGAGNDTYVIQSGDTVTELANEGTADTIQANFTYTLVANVENLTLTGSSAINGTGNTLDNVIDGSQNSAANTLTGGGGNDTYIVGSYDVVVGAVSTLVNNAATDNIDTVQSAASYTLGTNVDNLVLTGTANIN